MKTINFYDHGLLNNWELNSIALARNSFYCIGNVGDLFTIPANIALSNPTDGVNFGGWTLLMLTSDNNGDLYCLGTERNVGKLENDKWKDLGVPGGWALKMITFDENNELMVVGNDGNIGRWDGKTMHDLGHPGGWILESIAFDPNDYNLMYCVDTAHNLGVYNVQTKEMVTLESNLPVKSAIIQQRPYRLIAVGTEGNVGTCLL